MKSIPFYILDVFTRQPFSGNQLAVFHDPHDQLDLQTMQNLAREINFAESSFIKEQLNQNTFRVRIFTPECEVPFAGHPTLGTANVIRQKVLDEPLDAIHLQLKAGLVPVEFNGDKGFMTQIQPAMGELYDKAEIATLIGLKQEDFASMPIQEVSTGLPYLIVPLQSLKALESIRIEKKSWIGFLKQYQRHIDNSPFGQSSAFYFFCPDRKSEYRGRMFCLEQGKVIEDAATGSANGCLLAYLLTHQSQQVNCRVQQGVEMGRPSLLHLQGEFEKGHYTLRVGGSSVLVAEGNWNLTSGE